MRKLAKGFFALFVALQPLSTSTLLGVFGSHHAVRLAIVDGGLNLVLVHSGDSLAGSRHHHTAADRILTTSADPAADAGNHVIRSAQSDVTPAKRAAIALPFMMVSPRLPAAARASRLASRPLDASPVPSSRTAPLLL